MKVTWIVSAPDRVARGGGFTRRADSGLVSGASRAACGSAALGWYLLFGVGSYVWGIPNADSAIAG